MIYVTDIFREIAERVGAETGKNINYLFGDDAAVNLVLKKMNGSKTEKYKYPLIWLYHPFRLNIGASKDFFATTHLNFMIAVNTVSEYDNYKRMEISFKQTLYPVYESLLHQIKEEKRFKIDYDGQIEHILEDEFRFGSRETKDSTGEQFPLIDAIKIKQLKITIKNKECYEHTRI